MPRTLRKLGLVGLGIGLAGATFSNITNHERFMQFGLFRMARAGSTVLCIMFDYKRTMWLYSGDEVVYRQKMNAAHTRNANRLLALARKNGGVYIKVGQHLAALEYLLPPEYIDTLNVLHSRAPESRLSEVKMVIQEDLNAKIEDLFSHFSAQPEGAASLAQVYRAVLRENNEEVAVKVQHIYVKPRSKTDIKTMELLTSIAAWLFPDFHFMWLVDETKRNLPRELDFRVEAENADKLRRMFSHLMFLKIPKIYHKYTTDRVLTMEYCEGAQINDLDYFINNEIDRFDVCRKLGTLFSEMIFMNGYVHCDPHPGNVLINKLKNGKSSIVLLDHGLYLTLEPEFRNKYSKLWLALLKPDLEQVKECAQSLGVGDLYGLFVCILTSRSWDAIGSGIDKTVPTDQERKQVKLQAAALIPQISQVLEKMPRSMLLILKTNDLLRSIEYRLGVQGRSDSFVQMARCCVRAVHERKIQHCNGLVSRLCVLAQMYITLLRIAIYQFYLMITNPIYAQNVK